jgi:hypothetical protein
VRLNQSQRGVTVTAKYGTAKARQAFSPLIRRNLHALLRLFRKCRRRNDSIYFFDYKVEDTQALPSYPYRDDALLIHQTIWDYVREVLEGHYGNTHQHLLIH